MKNSNHCVNNDFTNTFLAAQMRSLLQAVQSFKLSHYQSVSDIKRKNKLKRLIIIIIFIAFIAHLNIEKYDQMRITFE